MLHFFGSKEQLFAGVMRLPVDPTRLVAGLLGPGKRGLGERVVRAFIGVWDSPDGRHLVGLIRSVVDHEGAAGMMRDFFAHAVLGPIAASLDIDEPRRRASLAASQLFGLAFVRYIVKFEPIASADVDDLARWVGPSVQRYFAGDLAGRGSELGRSRSISPNGRRGPVIHRDRRQGHRERAPVGSVDLAALGPDRPVASARRAAS